MESQRTIDYFETFQWIVRRHARTTSRTLPLFFIMTSQLKHCKQHEAQLMTYDVIITNNGKVCDVRSLVCKIEVLNGHVREVGNGLLE